jgi:hypothetical protein
MNKRRRFKAKRKRAERKLRPAGAEAFKVGDVIQIHRGPGVPVELRDKYFRVEALEARGVRLSLPYLDRELKRRYYASLPPVSDRAFP